MKKLLLLPLFLLLLLQAPQSHAQTTINVFDTILYYDGYAATVATPAPPTGVIRQSNSLYSRRLTPQELSLIGDQMDMNVTVKAACDNYDRIGNINLALVPAGSSTYNPDSVTRIELGRFITPFMNKNAQPDTVPYMYSVNNVAHLLRQTSLLSQYDIWIELQLFGVPYAANTQIAGCSGRNDVFYGSLSFVTNTALPAESNNVLIPLAFQTDFNNYTASATDTIGTTTKTFTFNVDSNLTDAALFLITSNHGANTGGEEYNRRNHFVYFDDSLIFQYKPGSTSCEPHRVYNTQSNGIYGNTPKSDAQWQSFSNWCPGDTIPIRKIELGALTAGTHKFMIRVPDAQFASGQGNIPLSLYLQGKTSGNLAIDAPVMRAMQAKVYPSPASEFLNVEVDGQESLSSFTVVNAVGATVYPSGNLAGNKQKIDISSLQNGIYTIQIHTKNDALVKKFQVIK